MVPSIILLLVLFLSELILLCYIRFGYKGGNVEQRREFWIAFGLNFIFPGGGHIYAGETKPGIVMLVIYLFSIGLTPFIYFPGLIVIGIWLYALIKTNEVVEAFNLEIEKKRKIDEEKKITSEQFVTLINKANQLFVSEIISEDEFKAKKQNIISDLQFKTFIGKQDDLLL